MKLRKYGIRVFCLLLLIHFQLTDYGFTTIAQQPSEPAGPVILSKIASLRTKLERVRMRSFEQLDLHDQLKTAGIISELLDRAEQMALGLLPAGRFEWSWSGFGKPDEILDQAQELLDILSAGKDPFEGKYAEPGGYVVDHAIIKKDGLHHLFYIRGTAATNWPEYPLFNFGHAVSRDLKNWDIEQPVLQCPEKGWDLYQVWAPHVLQFNGTYYMFYAGVNRNVSQAVCLATSTDLYDWKRYGNNPVITPGKWGVWDTVHWSDCRDPMVLQDGKTFYCYFTATRKDTATGKPEYCVGIASSDDLMHWKDEGFIKLNYSLATPPESPFAFIRDGKYYLIYTNYTYGSVYLTSPDPVKGWKELPADRMVLMGGVSASEIYRDGDKWYMTYISHQKNGLHFFEMKELQWNEDGGVNLK